MLGRRILSIAIGPFAQKQMLAVRVTQIKKEARKYRHKTFSPPFLKSTIVRVAG